MLLTTYTSFSLYLSTLKLSHHSCPPSSFFLSFLNSCIPFIFICACYSMLYLFYLLRYSFFPRSLQRLSCSLHFINLIFSSDTAFLLHSFYLIIPKCTAFSCTRLSLSTPTTSLSYYTLFILIFPNGSPNVLSIHPLSPQSNSPILFLISSPSLHPSFLSPHYFYPLYFYPLYFYLSLL